MNKKAAYSEIIQALTEKSGVSRKKSDAFSKALIKIVKEDLNEDGRASLTNFGSFVVKDVAGRNGRNPKTGEKIYIPAHKKVSFKPYKSLKEKVNNPFEHLQAVPVQTPKFEETKEAPQEVETSSEKKEPVVSIPKTEKNYSASKRKEKPELNVMIFSVIALALVVIVAGWYFLGNNEEPEMAEMAGMTEQTDEVLPEAEEISVQTNMNTVETVEEAVPKAASPQKEKAEDAVEYAVQKDEWFWKIADREYGHSEWWPLIFAANLSVDDDPDRLVPSNKLIIPKLEKAAELSKENYRKLAEATSLVSKAYEKAGKQKKANEYARFAKRYAQLGT